MMKFMIGWLAVVALMLGLKQFEIADSYDIEPWVRADTTYASGVSAYLVPTTVETTVIIVGGQVDTSIVITFDPDSVPPGTPGRWFQGSGDSAIFLSYQIADIPAVEKDSAFIDSVWSDWGLGTPLAYNITVPGEPEEPPPSYLVFCDTCSITDTTLAYWHWNAESYDSTMAMLSDAAWGSTTWQPAQCRPYNYDTLTNRNLCSIYLDTSQEAAFADFTKAIRYFWWYDTVDGVPTRLADSTPNASVGTNHYFSSSDTIREVWAEFVFKGLNRISGCSNEGTCDHKMFFLTVSYLDSAGGSWQQVDREAIHAWGGSGDGATGGPYTAQVYDHNRLAADSSIRLGGGEPVIITTGTPNGMCTNYYHPPFAKYLADGNWHQIRWYSKHSTVLTGRPSTNSMDARTVYWIDGMRVIDSDSAVADGTCQNYGTWNTRATDVSDTTLSKFLGFTLGANKDHGGWYNDSIGGNWPIKEEWLTSYISVFTSDPGWEMWSEPVKNQILFGNYSTTTNLLNDEGLTTDTTKTFIAGEDLNINTTHVELVADGASPDTKSMQYKWWYGDFYNGAVGDTIGYCQSQTISRSVSDNWIVKPDAAGDLREVWVEWWGKFSENYHVCNSNCAPCAHKYVFFGSTNSTARWAWHIGGGGEGTKACPTFSFEAPQDSTGSQQVLEEKSTGATTLCDLTDNAWHRFRWHVKYSTTNSSDDGLIEAWIDNERIFRRANFSTNTAGSIWAWQAGRNKDKGQYRWDTVTVWPKAETTAFSNVQFFMDDPGW